MLLSLTISKEKYDIDINLFKITIKDIKLNSPEFITAFKEYLPLFAALVTLTATGVFGFLLKNIKGKKEMPNSAALLEAINIKEKLKASRRLDALDELRLNKAITKLTSKSINEIENIAAHNKYLGDQIMRDVGGFAFIAFILFDIELVLYAFSIYGVISNNYLPLILFGVLLPLYFFWETRKAKNHLQ